MVHETSGDVLDPVSSSSNTASDEVVIDPDTYLRSFNYGRVSNLTNGSTVREFTLVADDRQTMEISPGVFYNVWTFNGTIPGPTLRALKGSHKDKFHQQWHKASFYTYTWYPQGQDGWSI